MAGKELPGGSPPHLEPLVEALEADPEKSAYYRGLLRPLEQYDREHHGDLVRTLTAYLRHGGHSNRTAAALFLHRNSLRYRLARIQAQLGLDPDDPDARLALSIAILLSAREARTG